MVMRALVILACLALTACGEDTSKPYLEFAGGGFVFNYRNAEAFYGFVAKPVRPMPEHAVIEAAFEVPGKYEPAIVTEPARAGRLQYTFQSPNLTGIVKDRPYKVILRVLDGGGKELARYERAFKSDIDQASMPGKPLVVGPGYQPNPDLAPN